MGNKRRKKGKRVKMSLPRKIVFIIALMVFIGAGGVLADHYLTGWRAQKDLTGLANLKIEAEDLQTEKGIVIGKYAGLYQANPDIIGWIEIEGTRINYPVMQTKSEPEFYLRKNFKKEYSISGTPFMDAMSDIFIPTCNWTIYGHHMKDGTMFKDLVKYADYDFYQEHKYINFDTIYKGGQGIYEVVAAFYTQIYTADENVFKYYNYPGITTEAQLAEYIAGVKRLSEYNTGVDVKFGEQVITLSTCNYHVGDGKGRFVVVAKRIK